MRQKEKEVSVGEMPALQQNTYTTKQKSSKLETFVFNILKSDSLPEL